jgi:hypothetical protein
MTTSKPIELGKASRETKQLDVGPSDNIFMTEGTFKA